MTEPLTPRKRIQLHFDVATDDQAAELSAAWQEIVPGKRAWIVTCFPGRRESVRGRCGKNLLVFHAPENK